MVNLHKYADKPKHNLTLHMTVELLGPGIGWHEAILGWIIYLQHLDKKHPESAYPQHTALVEHELFQLGPHKHENKCTSIH